MKRGIDIIGSLLGLILFFPVLIAAALAIRLGTGGSVFYRQERVGKDSVPFMLLKFRTMHAHADRLQSITVGKRDPRITPIGYFLRRYKLDELPQLMNVLRGEMSLVGPRPELKQFTDLYTSEQKRVLSVRPGITDPASIHFRNENDLLEGNADPIHYYIHEILPLKLSLNLRYIQNRSIVKDIRIILITVISIFK